MNAGEKIKQAKEWVATLDILYGVVGEGISEKMAFEHKPEGSKRVRGVWLSGKEHPGG